ncbi:MAG: signal peptide peptidase SppA [Ignavibacteria bacterium]|nr:signal peptide peptidase SppA [Ignavibacteria bacterium]
MKKFYLLIITFFFVYNSFSQSVNLSNPANEIYLFSAYDEGSHAFRYNPAVLGLGHRLNLTLTGFLENYRGKINFSETDVSLNSGPLGLAYRNSKIRNLTLHQLNLGLGFGNKTFSSGLSLEAKIIKQNVRITEPAYTFEDKFSATLGFLFRPYSFISSSVVIQNEYQPNNNIGTAPRYTLGIAVRPLKNDLLTLLTDFSIYSYQDESILKNNSLKLGIDVQFAKGLYLGANYTIHNHKYLNKSGSTNQINGWLKVNLPNSVIRYTNSFSRVSYSGDYSENLKYRSLGSLLGFSWTFERQKSLVPEKKKITEITLSGTLQDYHTEDVFFGLLGKGRQSIHEVIAEIDHASADPSVKGMLLKIYPLSTGRLPINAAVEELSAALLRFRKSGKYITAYFPQDAGPAEYFLASSANSVVMPEEGMLFYGLSVEVFNYKQFLEKYGIELQNFYAGKYKLTFQGLLDSTTQEAKEVINRMLDLGYEKMLSKVSNSRNIQLNDNLKEKLSQPLMGEEALKLGLVDKLGWYNDAREIAIKNSNVSEIVKSYNKNFWDNNWSEPDKIAVIGIYGSITTGESEAPSPIRLPIPFIGGGRSTGSETVVRQLEDAFSDSKVKAVILRVDSGGGSALGSAEINAAIIRLKKKYKKPFYVSMGSAAASGGYYISVNADQIFADDLTITGSIGVFTSRLNLDSLLSNQKIKVETFSRGQHSEIGTSARKLDEKEIEIIQGIINYYYDKFIEAISEGRKMSKEEIEEVAQGRVWLGSDAFRKKLVDQIGGLYNTIEYAKKECKIGERYKISYYAVPGGSVIDELVGNSVLKYIQKNLSDIIKLENNDQSPEIKYEY